MKLFPVSTILLLFLLSACQKEDKQTLSGAFSIQIGKQIFTQNDIDYYDFSSHLIYLKPGVSFESKTMETGEFAVSAGNELIYEGWLLPGFSSLAPSGLYIPTPGFYNDYIIPICFSPDPSGQTDLRKDPRILMVLKSNHQYHAGLFCEIESIVKKDNKTVIVTLVLRNIDTFDLLILDPQKCGLPLFHYFTNGLHFYKSETGERFENNFPHVAPDPWNGWKKEWLTLLRSNESKKITIEYPTFTTLPSGRVKAYFEYPGLSFQVSREEVQQDNGRIWLGKLSMVREIELP